METIRHVVTLTFFYDEDEYPDVTDRQSAFEKATEEIKNDLGACDMHFDYEASKVVQ